MILAEQARQKSYKKEMKYLFDQIRRESLCGEYKLVVGEISGKAVKTLTKMGDNVQTDGYYHKICITWE